MKEFIQKYQKAIVSTGAISVLVICFYQQKELSKLRGEVEVRLGSESQLVDSLQSELFISQTINTRYEVALELLKVKDKKAADEFELIITTQTE